MSTPREHLHPDGSSTRPDDVKAKPDAPGSFYSQWAAAVQDTVRSVAEEINAKFDFTQQKNKEFYDWKFSTGDQKLARDLLGNTTNRIAKIQYEVERRELKEAGSSSDRELQALTLDQLKYELENAKLLIGDIKKFGVRLAISCKLDDPALQSMWIDNLLKCGMPWVEISRIIAENSVKERVEFTSSSHVIEVEYRWEMGPDGPRMRAGANYFHELFRFGREGYDRAPVYMPIPGELSPGSGIDQTVALSPSMNGGTEHWVHIYTRDTNDPTRILLHAVRFDGTLGQFEAFCAYLESPHDPNGRLAAGISFDDRIRRGPGDTINFQIIAAAAHWAMGTSSSNHPGPDSGGGSAAGNAAMGTSNSDRPGADSGGGFAAQLEHNLNEFAQRRHIDAWVTSVLSQQLHQMMMGHMDPNTLASTIAQVVSGMRDRIIAGENLESWFNGSRNRATSAEANPFYEALGMIPKSTLQASSHSEARSSGTAAPHPQHSNQSEHTHPFSTTAVRHAVSSPGIGVELPTPNSTMSHSMPIVFPSLQSEQARQYSARTPIRTAEQYHQGLGVSYSPTPQGVVHVTADSRSVITVTFSSLTQTLNQVTETTAKLDLLERAIDDALARVNLARAHGPHLLPESLRCLDRLLSDQINQDAQFIQGQVAQKKHVTTRAIAEATPGAVSSANLRISAPVGTAVNAQTPAALPVVLSESAVQVQLQNALGAKIETGASSNSVKIASDIRTTQTAPGAHKLPEKVGVRSTVQHVSTSENVHRLGAVMAAPNQIAAALQSHTVSTGATNHTKMTQSVATVLRTDFASRRISIPAAARILDVATAAQISSIAARRTEHSAQSLQMHAESARVHSDPPAREIPVNTVLDSSMPTAFSPSTTRPRQNNRAAITRRKKLDRLLAELRQQALRQGIDIAQILAARHRLRAHKLYREGILMALLDALKVDYALRSRILAEIALAPSELVEVLRLEEVIGDLERLGTKMKSTDDLITQL